MSNQKRKRKKKDNEIQTTDSHNQQTALHLAASNGHLDVCRLLLDRGADKNAKNSDEKTPSEISKEPIKSLILNYVPSTQQPNRAAEISKPEEQLNFLDKSKILPQLANGQAITATKKYLQNKGLNSEIAAWISVVEIATSEGEETQKLSRELESRIGRLAQQKDAAEHEKEQTEETIKRLEQQPAEETQHLSRVMNEVRQKREEFARIQEEQARTQKKLENIKKEHIQAKEELSKALDESRALEKAIHSKDLKQLMPAQVERLLKDAGLGQHVEKIKQQMMMNAELLGNEKVTDDQTMEKHLGMGSIVDRKRLRCTFELIKQCGIARGAAKEGPAERGVGNACWWNPRITYEWLVGNDGDQKTCQVLRQKGVTGEVLMFMKEDEVTGTLGGNVPVGITKWIMVLADRLKDSFFAAQRAIPSAVPSSSSKAPQPSAPEPVEIPREFVCPITLEIMEYPVVLAGDGFVYEREVIEKWIQNHDQSPSTGAPLKSKELIECFTLRSAIQSFLDKHPEHRTSH